MTTDAIKTFVLDTSVILSSPRAIFAFAEHRVVLPLVVVKELEGKRQDPELGGPARTAIRLLEELRVTQPQARHTKRFKVTPEGGELVVELNHIDMSIIPEALRRDTSHDTRILAVAANLAAEGEDVTVVSKDLTLRFIASTALGLKAEEYRRELADNKDNYTGMVFREVEKNLIDALYEDDRIPFDIADLDVPPVNTGVVLNYGRTQMLTRVVEDRDGITHLEKVDHDTTAFGLKPRSPEQKIALAHLLDEEIGIVSLGGRAGTGKSVTALAAAMEAVVEKGTHKRIIVFRPLFAVGGQDLGFLPGTEAEKMGPWGAAVFDGLRGFTNDNAIEAVLANGQIDVLPLTHIRGRTFTDTIIIVDEAQQLERSVLLTALSRVGKNSRVFLTHDVAQRDNLRVGRHDGIAAVIEALKGHSLFAHVELVKSERSAVAALVTGLLDDLDG